MEEHQEEDREYLRRFLEKFMAPEGGLGEAEASTSPRRSQSLDPRSSRLNLHRNFVRHPLWPGRD